MSQIDKSGARVLDINAGLTRFPAHLTHRNHLNSYSFRNMIDGREVFPFYTEARFRHRKTRVTLLNLWKLLEFFINLDNVYPQMRLVRKFWEQYVNAIVRGKEIIFELEVVKPGAGRQEAGG